MMWNRKPPVGERISWPLTYAYFYVTGAIVLALCAAIFLWWSWESARRQQWTQLVIGALGTVLAAIVSRQVGGLYDLWLRNDTLVFCRGRRRVEVPLDRVMSLDISTRTTLATVVALRWIDDDDVHHLIRFAVTRSRAWLALFQRLTDRVPPVRIVADSIPEGR